MAWNEGFSRHRVFVEDARGNGQFLRVTWHGDRRQFVVSNWEGTMCVGATRVPVAQAVGLIGLLTQGLADAVDPPSACGDAGPRTLAEHLRAWWRGRPSGASVVPLRAGVQEPHRRSA